MSEAHQRHTSEQPSTNLDSIAVGFVARNSRSHVRNEHAVGLVARLRVGSSVAARVRHGRRVLVGATDGDVVDVEISRPCDTRSLVVAARERELVSSVREAPL